MRFSRTGLVAATAALFVAAVPGAAADPLTPYATQQLNWGDCTFKPAAEEKPSQCARVTVPRDWADPAAGPELEVSISRAAVTGQRRGAILLNPGGPGGQGTTARTACRPTPTTAFSSATAARSAGCSAR